MSCRPDSRILLRMFHILCLVAFLSAFTSFAQDSGHDMHNSLEKFQIGNVRHTLDDVIQLGTSHNLLRQSGQWVEITWKGVQDPQDDDYLALYAPANVSIYETSPVKYQWAVKAASHRAHGAGTIRFRLLNLRTDMRIAFIRNGFEFPIVAAWGEVIKVANVNEPLQGHLALTGENSEMLIQWTTKNSSAPEVRWGLQSGMYTAKAAASSMTYTKEDLCGAPANAQGWLDPGTLHKALMTDLQAGQRYFYVYGDETHGFSQEASFQAAPTIGPESHVRFLAIADMGQAEIDGSNEESEMIPALNTTRLMIAEADNKQLLIHNGDISYARGYSSQWDVFFDQVEPLVTRMPYMTTIGNHERNWPNSGDRFPAQYDSGGECGVAYERRLQMPSPAEDKPWYSFDFGPIHFLQYSTEHVFAKGSEQHAFMIKNLASVNRTLTPWLVVGGHRPFYIDSTNNLEPDGDQPVARALRDALEDAFFEYQVDMTWHGHHHSYQRTCPVYKERCLPFNADGTAAGPVHLVIGHAGAGLCLNTLPQRPLFWERVELTHGYMRVEANGTDMHCEVVTDVDGSVMDSFTLHKPPGWQTKDAHSVEHWEQSVVRMAGMSGPADNPAQAGLQGMQDAVRDNGFLGHGWIQCVVHYIRRHGSNMLHQFLSARHIV